MGTTIIVEGQPVGLIGLEGAISMIEAKHGPDLSPERASEMLLSNIETRNYIPPSRRQAYKKALSQLWIQRQRKKESDKGQDAFPLEFHRGERLTIRILGKDCISCNRLEGMIASVLHRMNIAADIEYVTDLDEIWKYGVIGPPALVINGKVVCAGRYPTQAQVEAWIRDAYQGIRSLDTDMIK